MAIVQLFFSTIRSSRIVFPDGAEGAVIDGRFATSDPDKIAYMESEISKGHPFWYRDKSNLECEEKMLDPMEALRAKIIQEAIDAGVVQAASTSEYVQAPLKPSSSADLVDTKTPEEIALASLTAQTGSDIAPPPVSPIADDKLAALLASTKK